MRIIPHISFYSVVICEISVTKVDELEEILLLDKHRKFSKTKISKERALALELEILERKRGEF